MERIFKFGFPALLAVLVIWGVWSLLKPAERRIDQDGDGVIRLVLDPGHGGSDPGAMVEEDQEKDIALAIALLVRDFLADREGLEIIMTREEDTYPSLTDRSDLANECSADLYFSIHVNALATNDTYDGIITFYHPDKRSDRALAKAIQDAIISSSGGTDRGVQTGNYAVLRETEMPAVLIETGFITTPAERARLTDPDYQALLARGIADGISAYLDM